MKNLLKGFMAVVIFTTLSFTSNAQTEIGGGVTLGGFGATGIEAKANFGVSDAISISPSFDYFLTSYSGVTMFLLSGDAHYNFEINDKFVAYPLAGLSYLNISGFGYSWGSGIGFNLGGGATYQISDKMKLYGELKYMRMGAAIGVGVMFNL
jgi:opacity protein-like surface antigen